MLAEIAAANAAFSVIKKAIQNTGDITKAGKAIGDFVFAKDMLKKEYKGEGGDFLVYDVENKQNINEAFDVFPDHSTIRAVKTIRPEENCLIGFVNFQNS